MVKCNFHAKLARHSSRTTRAGRSRCKKNKPKNRPSDTLLADAKIANSNQERAARLARATRAPCHWHLLTRRIRPNCEPVGS